MSQDLIIKRELYKFKKQKLNESNTFGFPTGAVDSGKVNIGGDGGNWGGSMERALEIASFAKKCLKKDNVISSQKRSRVKTASGNVSDHYEKNMKAYAVDIPVKGKAGDELLACIMKSWDNGSHADYKGGKWLNVNKDGYRYQFGWKVKDHYDHIHVGVKKTSSSIKDDKPDEDDHPVTDVEKDDEKGTTTTDGLPSALAQLKSFTDLLRGIKPPSKDEESDENEEDDSDQKSDEEKDVSSSSNVPVVDIKDYKITEPSNDDKDFYTKVLDGIDAPLSKQNYLYLYAWRQAEGAKSTFNPFNTTQKKEGATFWNCLKRKNGGCIGGVRNYKSKQDGIDATVKTLTNGNYKCIVDGLKSDKGATQIAKCSDLKTWGTGDLVSKVLSKKTINPPEISKTKVKSVNESFDQEKQRIEEIIKKIL